MAALMDEGKVMFKTLINISLISMLTGCVLYPTTRNYYKPVIAEGQVEAASAACGYHTAKYDGIEQQNDNMLVGVYPHFEAEGNTLTLTFATESEYDNIELTLDKVTSNDVLLTGEPETLTRSTSYVSDNVHRAWFTSKSLQMQEQADTLTLFVSDNYGNEYQFKFEFTRKKDIYYSSINC
jgi:cytochrome c biogenesis protein ResB